MTSHRLRQLHELFRGETYLRYVPWQHGAVFGGDGCLFSWVNNNNNNNNNHNNHNNNNNKRQQQQQTTATTTNDSNNNNNNKRQQQQETTTRNDNNRFGRDQAELEFTCWFLFQEHQLTQAFCRLSSLSTFGDIPLTNPKHPNPS